MHTHDNNNEHYNIGYNNDNNKEADNKFIHMHEARNSSPGRGAGDSRDLMFTEIAATVLYYPMLAMPT